MDARELFLLSDAAFRSVVDRLTPDDLEHPVPPEWSGGHRAAAKTMRDIIGRHAYDEAWVPDLLAGRTIDEVGDRWSGDLLGDDPIAAYDALNDAATAAMTDPALDTGMTVHFSYGDYPFDEGILHPVSYRAFQAWQISRLLGTDFHLSPELIAGLNELLLPTVSGLRAFGVFPPEQTPPSGADAETRLLCAVGYWHE
ncbi:MAG: hypothetical protein ABIP33_01440 [Pseudolysinimonas sp.]